MNELNVLRTSIGERPLSVNEPLLLAATRHASDMNSRGYLSHDSPSPSPYGGTPGLRAKNSGFQWSKVSECIHYDLSGIDSAVITGMVYNGSNKEKMLSPSFNVAGFSHAGGYWVLMLGFDPSLSDDFTEDIQVSQETFNFLVREQQLPVPIDTVQRAPLIRSKVQYCYDSSDEDDDC